MAIAVALRLGASVLQGDSIEELPGIFDQVSYQMLAHRVLEGDGFTVPTYWWPATEAGEPTAHWSYLYTIYLTSVYFVVGDHPIVARILQAVLSGTLQVFLTFRIAERVFGRRQAYISAAIAASYLYFIYYSSALLTETFTILALLWIIDLATGRILHSIRPEQCAGESVTEDRPDRVGWLLLGLAIGTAALLRQVTLVFAPILVAWLMLQWWRAPTRAGVSKRQRVRCFVQGILIMGSVVTLMIAPWSLRNYDAFGRFVLLNTSSGYVLFWANHPIHGTEFIPILPSVTYMDLIPEELRGMNEAALDSALLQRGLQFIQDDPNRYILLSLSRIKEYFKFWPSADSSTMSNVVRVFSFGLIVPFVLAGMWRVVQYRNELSPQQSAALTLLVLFITSYSTIHLLSWTLIRYRMPVDAVLIIFASVSISALISTALTRSRMARGA
ncbi:MAG: hypothetical protein ACKVVP_06060 [Chloroflexota bacterium]